MLKSNSMGELQTIETPRKGELYIERPLQKSHVKKYKNIDERSMPTEIVNSRISKTKTAVQPDAQNGYQKKRNKNKDFCFEDSKACDVSPKANNHLKNRPSNSRRAKTSKQEFQINAVSKRLLTSTDKRRVANARERTRVHTLSSAFNSLRQAIPCYSVNQRLSKLTILKVAISYIAALDALNRDLDTNDVSDKFEENVNECTKALQSEYGRTKRRGWILRT